MESLFGFVLVLAVAAFVIVWCYFLNSLTSAREERDWYESHVKGLVGQCTILEDKCNGLIDRNTDLEELVDTLHDERAQIRRWYAEAPKWMAEPAKPE